MDRYIPGWGMVHEEDKHILGNRKILKDPDHVYNTGNGNTLCYLPHHEIWFYSSPYAVLEALYLYNRKFICEFNVTEGSLYEYLKLPKELWNYDECGYDTYKGEIDYGHAWIDFYRYSAMTESGKPVLAIEPIILPYPDYLEPERTDEVKEAHRRWEYEERKR